MKAETHETGLGYSVEGVLTLENSRMRWIAHFLKGKLIVKQYYYEERKSTRHKWNKKQIWDWYDNRGSNLQEPHGIPHDLSMLMMKSLIDYISKELEVIWKEQ